MYSPIAPHFVPDPLLNVVVFGTLHSWANFYWDMFLSFWNLFRWVNYWKSYVYIFVLNTSKSLQAFRTSSFSGGYGSIREVHCKTQFQTWKAPQAFRIFKSFTMDECVISFIYKFSIFHPLWNVSFIILKMNQFFIQFEIFFHKYFLRCATLIFNFHHHTNFYPLCNLPL
jgi:hypothetical protein